MVYPNNFETKVGFNEIRTLLKGRCLSAMGVDEVGKMEFCSDAVLINEQLAIVREFRSILDDDLDFPMQNFTDVRSSLVRIQIKGSYLDETELFGLRNTMETLSGIVKFLTVTEDSGNVFKDNGGDRVVKYKYPLLAKMSGGVELFPRFLIQVDSILNNYGKIKDNASPELQKSGLPLQMPDAVLASRCVLYYKKLKRMELLKKMSLLLIGMAGWLYQSSLA